MLQGDWLLFLNNAVLGIMFIPTLLKRDAKVSPATAGVYVIMIAIGAYGYAINHQWLPAVPTGVGSFLWLIMFFKSIK